MVESRVCCRMYTLPYGSGEVEPRHYKIEWLSLLGAVAAALVLLIVAYFSSNQDGLQKVALICIVVAGLTVVLCMAALFAHFYVAKQRPKPDNDAPPTYKNAWRRAFYFRRMTETHGPVESDTSSAFTPILLSDLELQHGLPPGVSVPHGSAAHLVRQCCALNLTHNSSQAAASPVLHHPASSFRHDQHTSCVVSSFTQNGSMDECQVTGSNDPPSYEEAMQFMDMSSSEANARY